MVLEAIGEFVRPKTLKIGMRLQEIERIMGIDVLTVLEFSAMRDGENGFVFNAAYERGDDVVAAVRAACASARALLQKGAGK